MEIQIKREEILDVQLRAIKETELERALKHIIKLWKDVDLPITVYKEQRDVFILGNIDELFT